MSLKLTNVVLPGTGYRHISEFIVEDIFADLPNKSGLVGAYFLSSQVGSPLNNYANLNIPLLKIGSPVVGSKYATTGTTNFYDTQLPSTPVMTVMGISLLALIRRMVCCLLTTLSHPSAAIRSIIISATPWRSVKWRVRLRRRIQLYQLPIFPLECWR